MALYQKGQGKPMFKVQKFLLSNKNMLGLAFSSLVILFAFLGLIKSFWLPFSVIAYGLGYFVGPVEKEIKFYHFKGENLTDYIGFLRKLVATISVSPKIPNEAKFILTHLGEKANELLDFLHKKNDLGIFNEDMNNLKSIFDTYLPKLINEYEKLPIDYANNVKTSNGKTAKEMLLEQLKLLDKTVQEIAYGIYENDVTALKVNGRLLKQKFEQTQLFEIEANSN